MPLIRRMPKRGFNNARFTTSYAPINVDSLNRFDEGARIDEAALRAAGLANGPAAGIKVLGTGELKKKLIVCAHAFSRSARAKIEAAGGQCELARRPSREGQPS